jgi:hypothetical protein
MHLPQQNEQQKEGNEEANEDESEDESVSESGSEYEDESSEEDDDPFAMNYATRAACEEGDTITILSLLNSGRKNVNCLDTDLWSPILLALRFGHLRIAEMLFARGAKVTQVNRRGDNALFAAVFGGSLSCVRFAFANTSIAVNSSDSRGRTPLMFSLEANHLVISKELVERGGDLFYLDNSGERAIERQTQAGLTLGPQVLQHAKDLIWTSVRPFLLLSKTGALGSAGARSLVLGNEDLVRWIATFLKRGGIIAKDPDDEELDEVRERIEAGLRIGKKEGNKSGGRTRMERKEKEDEIAKDPDDEELDEVRERIEAGLRIGNKRHVD